MNDSNASFQSKQNLKPTEQIKSRKNVVWSFKGSEEKINEIRYNRWLKIIMELIYISGKLPKIKY